MNLVYGYDFIDLLIHALNLGAKNLNYSKKHFKKYKVTLQDGTTLDFGDKRHQDFLIHKNDEKRLKYRNRASKIKNKNNELTHLNPKSANFWSFNILW